MKRMPLIVSMSVVLLALGGLATWDEWQTKKDQESEKVKNRILQIAENDVLRFSYNSKPFDADSVESEQPELTKAEKVSQPVSYEVQRSESQWRLVNPVNALADQNSVSSLLSTLLEYSYSEQIGQGEGQWEKYGLKDPVRTITLQVKDPTSKAPDQLKTWSIYIGNKVPVGYNVYFRTTDSDRIYMGSQHLLLATAKSLFEMRDKQVAAIKPEVVNGFQFYVAGQLAVDIEKKGNSFQFKMPSQWELDPQDLRDYLSYLGEVKAISYIDTALSENHAVQSGFEMTWFQEGGIKGSLKFGIKDNKYWVIRDQTVIEISEADYKKLNRKPEDFRLKRVFGLKPLEIVKIDIDGAKYERRGGLWYKPEDLPKVDSQDQQKSSEANVKDVGHVASFVMDMEFLKTEKFYQTLDPATLELLSKQPLHIISLEMKDQQTPIKVSVFESGEKDYFLLKHSASESVFYVKKTALANMSEDSSKKKDEGAAFKDGAIEPLDFDGRESGQDQMEIEKDDQGERIPTAKNS